VHADDQLGASSSAVIPRTLPGLDAQSSPFRLGNRPALTGIRALLIACILAYHSNFQSVRGAWAVMDVFFVLSGFLITTMLASEHQKTGAISISHFYSRRAVRLLPPLFITVALLAIYACFVRVNDAAQHLWGDISATVFYYADYREAFGHQSPFGFLAQCWSLAVEEQFYLVWAVLMFVALRYGNRKLAYFFTIVGIGLSVGDRMWIVLRAPVWSTHVYNRVYYAFDTRADALFLGCLLGLIATGGHLDNWNPWAKRCLAALAVVSAGLMIFILFYVHVGSESVALWYLPVTEVASAIIITYLLIHPRSLSTRALGIPILVLVGNMSYAMYLFHWPVYVAISPFTVRWPFWMYESVRLVIIFALAIASWYLVEGPLTRWRRKAYEPPSSVVPADSASETETPSTSEAGPLPVGTDGAPRRSSLTT
jgi:peptidoglycan/LPS O-acetylase OafA/YrhL